MHEIEFSQNILHFCSTLGDGLVQPKLEATTANRIANILDKQEGVTYQYLKLRYMSIDRKSLHSAYMYAKVTKELQVYACNTLFYW